MNPLGALSAFHLIKCNYLSFWMEEMNWRTFKNARLNISSSSMQIFYASTRYTLWLYHFIFSMTAILNEVKDLKKKKNRKANSVAARLSRRHYFARLSRSLAKGILWYGANQSKHENKTMQMNIYVAKLQGRTSGAVWNEDRRNTLSTWRSLPWTQITVNGSLFLLFSFFHLCFWIFLTRDL